MMLTADGVSLDITLPGLSPALVVFRGFQLEPKSAALDRLIDEAIQSATRCARPEAITQPIRAMLRHGRYKPTGRGKPASEYLLRSALEGRFPRISLPVDIGNAISLSHLLPLSLIDLEKAQGQVFRLRHGRPGESYVFNASGQRIELEDLLLVAADPGDRPLANPIKDAMAGKLRPEATDVLGVIYGPTGLKHEVQRAAEAMASAFETFGQAKVSLAFEDA